MSRANSQAFPTPAGDYGLTIREHFAALAMQGILADHTVNETPELLAGDAVRVADALIAELAKGRAITQLGALYKFGIGRLAARIHSLRRNFGWEIRTEMVRRGRARVASYSMVRR